MKIYNCKFAIPVAAVAACLLLPIVLGLGGCGGCRNAPTTPEDLEKQLAQQRAKPKPKPDFEIPLVGLRTQPGGGPPTDRWYKPGHWTTVGLPLKANNFHFLGELDFAAVDVKGNPIPLPATPFETATLRQAALAKGQPKRFESVVFARPTTSRSTLLSCRLRAAKGGYPVMENSYGLMPMPSYQYHFVVLARWPTRYAYLAGLDSFNPPSDELSGDPMRPYYRVALLPGDRRAPLPSEALCWTSIAALLWDDAEPTCLELPQQQALLDWLHWGGQLILSGPDTLDTLRDSFLAPYLPALAEGGREIAQPDLAELARFGAETGRDLILARPWTGAALQGHPAARFLPGTGGLLAERRVGRGRIVVSAFRLSEVELKTWPGWDSVVNACLLRRGPRRFYGERESFTLQVNWADGRSEIDRCDAARTTHLRYFARDAGAKLSDYGSDVTRLAPELGEEVEFSPGPGVAAWNDFNPVAQAAREALLEAARIEVPQRSFVVIVLAGYLLVLVPGNWLVFRLLGRVEWAWAAAPLIAVACTALVIRLAQLDIGFVRSRTEIAVLELQGDHPRAHLSRYTALYSSLAASYELRFGESGGMALPLPSVGRPEQFRMATGQRRGTIEYRRGEQARLSGFTVGSNSTGLVHSEQMVELAGGLTLLESGSQCRLSNRTGLRLRDAGVVRKMPSGHLQTVWLGTLEPGASAAVPFDWHTTGRSGGRLWTQRDTLPITRADPPPGELNLGKLIALAEDAGSLAAGQVRLIAWTDEPLPGMEIRPSAPQSRGAALIVAQLAYGAGEDPQPDVNSRAAVKRRLETIP